MIKRSIFPLLFAALLLFGCDRTEHTANSRRAPKRIVALSPAITETLFDLKLGDRLVGTSEFCDANRELNLPTVGSFSTLNYEALFGLTPELVILENGSSDQTKRLTDLHIPVLQTASLTLVDVMDSIRKIGKACHVPDRSDALTQRLTQQINAARNAAPEHPPRTLITFSDFSTNGQIEQVYAFGANCIHTELLEMAGGQNVVTDPRAFVTLSLEAVIRLNPDVIIELTSGGPGNNWSNLSLVNAVQNQNVHVLDGTYTCIPAPGCLIQTLNDFSRIVRQND